jgi:NAD(P)-dependent dehydrogenase (short-subunit alcohol dehydrogenase family)
VSDAPLAGQVAIITGGVGDIGSATARELARRGADVAVSDLHEPAQARKLLTDVENLGRKARYDRVDVSDAAAVRAWVAAVEQSWGAPATLVIANAAIVTLANVCELTPEQWTRELRVNLDGAFFTAQAGMLRMLERRIPGRIVFVGSWAAHAPHAHIPAYCAAKAGLRMLCKVMALELAPHGILVNEVAPGYVDAGLSGRAWADSPGAKEKAATRVPTGHLISAEEVAEQIAYLCDPRCRHMTGATLLMDGGLSLGLAPTRV